MNEPRELGPDPEWEREAAQIAEELRQQELEAAAVAAQMAHCVVD